MDERRVLTELLAERCGLEPDYMGELLELYRRTVNRIEVVEPVLMDMRKDTDTLLTSFGQLVDAAGAQQEEPPRGEAAADCETPQEAAPEPRKDAQNFVPIITGKGAQEKMTALARLDRVRAQGVSIARIASAAGMTENDVLDFIQRKPMKMEMYRRLDGGLAKLEE